MRLCLYLLMVFLPVTVRADDFARPIPQAQSATAEGLFLLASVLFLAALVAVQLLVNRR